MLKKLGLGIIVATSLLAAKPVHAGTNTNLRNDAFSQAELASTKTSALYDGDNLHFKDEQDQLIFSDDFSSNDFSKWTSNKNVNIIKDGQTNAAVFGKGAKLTLDSFPEFNQEGYYRVSYDVKYLNYTNQSDLGEVTSYFGIFGTSSLLPPFQVGKWQSSEDVYLSYQNALESSILNTIEITGPEKPITPDAEMYITNFKIYKVIPTYIENFANNKIDSRFTTNSKFIYSIIGDNDNKTLKVTLPKDSLSTGTYDNILTAKDSIASLIYDPKQKLEGEGLTFLTHEAVGNNDNKNVYNIRNFVSSDIDNQQSYEMFPSTTLPIYPDSMSSGGNGPVMFFGKIGSKSIPLTYGISANRNSDDMGKEKNLYIKDIQFYKGTFRKQLKNNNTRKIGITCHK